MQSVIGAIAHLRRQSDAQAPSQKKRCESDQLDRMVFERELPHDRFGRRVLAQSDRTGDDRDWKEHDAPAERGCDAISSEERVQVSILSVSVGRLNLRVWFVVESYPQCPALMKGVSARPCGHGE